VRGRTVDMDQYAVGGGALGAMARDGIAVVEMRMLPYAEVHAASGVEPDAQIALGVDLLDSPELSVSHMLALVRGGELDSVARRKLSLGFPIDADSLKMARIVGDLLAVFTPDRQKVPFAINADDADVCAGRKIKGAATLGVADDVADFRNTTPTAGRRRSAPAAV
jgi:hypothetical protein